MAITSGLTVYDSVYLWLSRKLNGKMVTVDEGLKKRGEKIAETISRRTSKNSIKILTAFNKISRDIDGGGGFKYMSSYSC